MIDCLLCLNISYFILFSAPSAKSPVVQKGDVNSDEEREMSDDYDTDRCREHFAISIH